MRVQVKMGVASDHAGFQLKELIISYLESRGVDVVDYGTNSTDSCDYPDYIHPMSEAVDKKELHFGVAICGSANGVAMTANKYPGVRAAICWLPEIADLARRHNDANVLCLPARYLTPDQAIEITSRFFEMPFDGGRHEIRVNKIARPS